MPQYPIIEPLEARIAPATLVNPQTVTYHDVDGDNVTVTVSKGDLTGKLIFTDAFANPGNQQLVSINLITSQFAGANLTITVQGNGGEGFANFGLLNAKGVDLGNVTMGNSSVNKILAGDANAVTPAIGNLTFYNLGGLSIAGATDVLSVVNGPIGDINMHDLNEARLTVVGGVGGTIKSIHATDIKGGTAAYSGSISTTGNLGPVTVSSIYGGSGDNSGQILVGGNLDNFTDNYYLNGNSGKASGSVIVKGSANQLAFAYITGGGGLGSGSINVTGNAGATSFITMAGGAADNSGQLYVGKNLASVSSSGVGGGGGKLSGAIVVKGTAGSIGLGSGTLLGGSGVQSGAILVQGTLAGVTANGITGGAGASSGAIIGGATVSSVHLTADLQGGAGVGSGRIQSTGLLGTVTIDGSVKSGTAAGSGSIVTNANIGSVTIAGDVTGSVGVAVVISALGNLKPAAGATTNLVLDTLTIAGDVKSLNVLGGYDITGKGLNADAQINSISIAKTVTGGNFVAGIAAGRDGFFGTADDLALAGGSATILSKIASIVITKQTVNSLDPSDAFGVDAQQVSAASVNGVALTLTAGPSNDKGLALGAATDFKLREI